MKRPITRKNLLVVLAVITLVSEIACILPILPMGSVYGLDFVNQQRPIVYPWVALSYATITPVFFIGLIVNVIIVVLTINHVLRRSTVRALAALSIVVLACLFGSGACAASALLNFTPRDSIQFNGQAYRLAIGHYNDDFECFGWFYAVYDCDRFGLMCQLHQTDSLSCDYQGAVPAPRVAHFIADSSENRLYVDIDNQRFPVDK